MKKKKILIIVGHPNSQSQCAHFADSYEKGAREGGHEIRRINLGDLRFDPILHKGYKEIQPLEPDLLSAQESIKWAEHIMVIHPTWFCTMPALLKGFFDRAWIPTFAYRFHKTGVMWEKLLKGRSARLVITLDAHPIIERLVFGNFTNEIARGIFWFAGIGPVRKTFISGMKFMTDARGLKWHNKLYRLGYKGK